MSANGSPRFTKNGVVGSAIVTAANTKSDGTGTIGTDIFKVVSGDASNGTFLEKLRLAAIASVASSGTTLTVCRIFVSSQPSGATTSANTYLIAEVSLPVQTADSPTVPTNPIEVPLGFTLPPNYTLLVTNHLAPAVNTNWRATVFGGDF